MHSIHGMIRRLSSQGRTDAGGYENPIAEKQAHARRQNSRKAYGVNSDAKRAVSHR
jgi:hypothetical protein